jgi:cobalt/nickel transport system permease protein
MNRVSLRLGASLALILGVGALPVKHALWGLWALPLLLSGALLAKLELRALLVRLAVALPFVLGVASLSLFGHAGFERFLALLVKCSVSILTLQLLTHTTPISDLLLALRRAHVPLVLCSTISLLHRYLFVLADESKRMRRARAGRTLRSSRLALWSALGTSIGLLFVRTVARAERVQAAMRARGGA